jgi:uncharacterized protein YndB with AHSA1/START domain
MSREFEVRREVELKATPEQVFEAVTTAEGNASWMFPVPVPPPDGTPGPGGVRATAWDPPHRAAVAMGEGDFYNAIEYEIEGRDGGTTLLRYVHSGIFVDDWDQQYDAVTQHTDFYLHTLGQYLEHFAGRTATYVGDVPGGIEGPAASASPDGFERLQRALGLPEDVAEGDAVQLSPDGLGALDGVVDYVRPSFLGIRTADGLYRFFGRNAFGHPVGAQMHLFGDVDADALKKTWKDWLERAYS